ncbi:hypothetical protein GCM10009565_51310 [Amycolatopsis albidoflavus]
MSLMSLMSLMLPGRLAADGELHSTAAPPRPAPPRPAPHRRRIAPHRRRTAAPPHCRTPPHRRGFAGHRDRPAVRISK